MNVKVLTLDLKWPLAFQTYLTIEPAFDHSIISECLS